MLFGMFKLIFIVLFITASASARFYKGLDGLNLLHKNTKTRVITNDFKTLAGSFCGTDTTCVSGSCSLGICNTTSNMCVGARTLSLGAACTYYDYCTNGLCIYSGGVGTCTAIKKYLCPCNFTAPVGNTQFDPTCDTGLCIQGKCNYLRYAGEACTQSYECYSNTCLSSVCTNSKNYGDLCSYVDSCPSDAYCGFNGSTNICLKYAVIGGNCTVNNCGIGAYCDSSSQVCKVIATQTAGQVCQSTYSQCALSCSCISGTCVTIVNGAPCDNYNCSGLCNCNNGLPTCQIIGGTTCDASYSSLISCLNTNCYTSPYNYFSGDSCSMKNCRSQFASAYCCFYSKFNYVGGTVSDILSYFDCSNNKFVGSGCDPNSTSILSASFATLFVALLLVLLV